MNFGSRACCSEAFPCRVLDSSPPDFAPDFCRVANIQIQRIERQTEMFCCRTPHFDLPGSFWRPCIHHSACPQAAWSKADKKGSQNDGVIQLYIIDTGQSNSEGITAVTDCTEMLRT